MGCVPRETISNNNNSLNINFYNGTWARNKRSQIFNKRPSKLASQRFRNFKTAYGDYRVKKRLPVFRPFYWTNYCRKYPKTFWNKIIDPFLNIYPQFRISFTVSLKEDLFNIKEPLSLLEPDSRLFSATKKHSIDLKNSWPTNSHNSSFGKTFQERLREDGLFDCASENISVGSAGVILHLIFLFIDEGLTDLGH